MTARIGSSSAHVLERLRLAMLELLGVPAERGESELEAIRDLYRQSLLALADPQLASYWRVRYEFFTCVADTGLLKAPETWTEKQRDFHRERLAQIQLVDGEYELESYLDLPVVQSPAEAVGLVGASRAHLGDVEP